MALDFDKVPKEWKKFHVTSLDEVASVLKKGLLQHFSQVTVEVVDCPDLTKAPFGLLRSGLNGKPKLVEVGTPSYLLPLVNRSKLYDLRDIAKVTDVDPAFIIGAGAGPFNLIGVNSEGIYNLIVKDGNVAQGTRIAKVTASGSSTEETLDDSAKDLGLLGNLFVSEGKPGKVVKVHVKKRVGSLDFVAAMRTTLADHFGPEKIVGLGGAFVIREGKAKMHVMPDFSCTPITNEELLNDWLNFYNMSAPLVAVGTFTTGEFDLDLRVQHFHAFSGHGEAGHYHIDTTPDIVEYEGYFNIADSVHRIDKSEISFAFGKD